jgi:ketosteroid isomerase-like protein
MQSDTETLTMLNHDYVASVQGANVKRFDEILADDFLCTNPDGSLYNRAQFIELIGKGPRISELREDQVNIRLLGDFAIIHARIHYRSKAGVERMGRFTDDWARRDGKWVCISAHTSGEDF